MHKLSFWGMVAGILVVLYAESKADNPRWVDPGWRQIYLREVQIEADGSSVVRLTKAVTAVDESGARAIAQQTFSYNAEFECLEVSDAETVKADGRIIPVDPRAMSDQAKPVAKASPIFSNARTLVVAFPNLSAGDSIRFKAAYRSKAMRIPGVFMSADYYPESSPPGEATIVFDAPVSMTLYFDTGGFTIEREVRGDRAIHRFVRRHDRPQPGTPALSAVQGAPHVVVTSLQDYAALAADLARRNASASSVTPSIAAKAREIVGSETSREQMARRLTHWVAANVRYVMMGLGDGGLVSEPAEDVLAMRYGDCKAHTMLLKALLAELGIASEAVLIIARQLYEVPQVAVQSFDHMILYVPEFDRYVDATSAMMGFDALPLGFSGKPVLHLDSGKLSRTRIAQPDDHAYLSTTDIRFEPDGRRSGTTRTIGSRVGDANLRYRVAMVERLDPKALAADYLKKDGVDGRGEIHWSPWRNLDQKMSITVNVGVEKAATSDKAISVKLLPFADPRPSAWQAIMGLAPKGPWVKGFVCTPVDLRESVTLTITPEMEVQTLPPVHRQTRELLGETPEGLVRGHIETDSRIVAEGRTIVASRRLVANFDAPVCPAAFAAEIEAAVRDFQMARNRVVTLRPAALQASIQDTSR